MVESRKHFHDELDQLEATIQQMGVAAAAQLHQGLEALVDDDPDLCDAVIAGDDVIDAHYILVERGVVELFALQGPVAMDLRLLATMLHVNLHLERIADMAVNVAKITRASAGLPRIAGVLCKLGEMGEIALTML
ncbi:MAG: phosphate signaling complex PhoU family protein, partial [Actinomycetota bacterium]